MRVGDGRRRGTPALLAAVGALVAGQVVGLVTIEDRPPVPAAPPPPVVAAPSPAPAPARPTPTPMPTPSPAAPPVAPTTVPEPDAPGQGGLAVISVDDAGDDAPPTVRMAAGGSDRAAFDSTFAAQAAAVQDPARPDTTRWALLVGINDHAGRTRDNVGSRQDAEDLRRQLLRRGWRDDHIVLLVDGLATRPNLEQGIGWLARKTDADSVAIFHYSGHTKQWPGADVDGDGEVLDEGLWPSDNDRMVDREFVDRMAAVGAGRLWVNIGACEAAGFADPGLRRRGRILTFSSREDQKSYEDPAVGNSVWGFYLDQALDGSGDLDGDGDVTVEEAFNHAAPRAFQRTAGQPRGPQSPVVMDDADGVFSLRIPPPPAPTGPPAAVPDPDPEPPPTSPCLLLCIEDSDGS